VAGKALLFNLKSDGHLEVAATKKEKATQPGLAASPSETTISGPQLLAAVLGRWD